MTFTKHPSYGYLTKEEYELMKSASYGDAKDFAAIAKKEKRLQSVKLQQMLEINATPPLEHRSL